LPKSQSIPVTILLVNNYFKMFCQVTVITRQPTTKKLLSSGQELLKPQCQSLISTVQIEEKGSKMVARQFWGEQQGGVL
jgi:hypothetical protein